MKLLVLGLDGLSDRMIRYNSMPYFHELETTSNNYGRLKSFATKNGIPYTGPCWTSIYTGLKPEVHGFDLPGWMYGENHFDAIAYRTVFDEIANMDDTLAISFTMPITFPATSMPEAVKTVAGFPAMPTGNRLVNDEALKEYTQGYLLDICDNPLYLRQTYMADYQMNEKKRFTAVGSMCDNLSPDILFLGLTFIDKLNHQQPQSSTYLREAYHFLDGLVYEYIKKLKPDALLICSDHGFQSGIWYNNFHDLNGYYMVSTFNSIGVVSERDLTYVAPAVSDLLGISNSWIGTKIDREREVYTDSEKELVISRMKALGYTE